VQQQENSLLCTMGNQIFATELIPSLADCEEISDFTALEAKYKCMLTKMSKKTKKTKAASGERRNSFEAVSGTRCAATKGVWEPPVTSRQGEESVSFEAVGEPRSDSDCEESRSRLPSYDSEVKGLQRSL
jgi:hypothetical protein